MESVNPGAGIIIIGQHQESRHRLLRGSEALIVVIRIGLLPFIVEEERGILLSRDRLERTRSLIQVKELLEIGPRPRIRERKSALIDAEIVLDESQNAAEVMPVVVYIALWRVCGNGEQRHAEPVLVRAWRAVDNGRRLVIVPASPVIPGNEYGRIIPIP